MGSAPAAAHHRGAMLISTGPRAAGADVGDHGDPMSLFWRVILVNAVVLVLAAPRWRSRPPP